jgi:hypothetical protein
VLCCFHSRALYNALARDRKRSVASSYPVDREWCVAILPLRSTLHASRGYFRSKFDSSSSPFAMTSTKRILEDTEGHALGTWCS